MNDPRLFLTESERAALVRYLLNVTYADVYNRVPSRGDGNGFGSPSDNETQETLTALHKVRLQNTP